MVNELINPKSIVVIGGSKDVQKPGGRILKNIIDGAYQGDLYVVNPKEDEVQGLKCSKTVEELPQVDLAILAIPAKLCPPTIKVLTEEKGTKGFIILSAGFSEVGEEGRKLEAEVVDLVEKAGGTLIGPNCIGVLTPTYQGVFAGPLPRLDAKGVDFVSGSGATACFILELAITRGLSFAGVYSVGNSAQTGVEDVLKYWDETFDAEKSSRVKLLYLEEISNPDLFLKYSRSLIAKGCKIAAIKSGTTDAGSRAVSSHTGALAGSDLAVSALFKKAGIIRCTGRTELMDVANVLLNKPLEGANIAVITHAGGPGVMLTDTLDKNGMKVPHIEGDKAKELLEKLYYGSSVANPIDFLATGTADQLAEILDYVENQFDEIDGAAVIFGTTGMFDSTPVYEKLYQKMKECRKPIYPVLPSVVLSREAMNRFVELGGTYFIDEEHLGEAIAKVHFAPKPMEIDYNFAIDESKIRQIINEADNGYLEPEKIQVLLDAVGLTRAKEGSFTDCQSACDFADEISYPVVAKVVGPVHKSDVGGVIVGIKDRKEMEAAYESLMKIPSASAVLLQEMLSGMEIFIGANREKDFGHLVLCGLGGIFIEVLKDFSFSLAPISKQEANEMIRSLKSYSLIKGIRGKEGVNEELLEQAIIRVSELLRIAPEIAEMDLNPLLGTSKSLVAVDARIRIEK